MPIVISFAVLAIVNNRVVDFIRNAFDKHDRFPKAYWIFLSWLVGVGIAWVACNVDAIALQLHIAKGVGCVGVVLTGMGLGSLAGGWHELFSAWSARTSANTPKGLVPSEAPPSSQPAQGTQS